ncbi:MAG: Fic family protein [Armatimonadetes bacterium]|nr:Fic family protein [Armatimonadota bacterium]
MDSSGYTSDRAGELTLVDGSYAAFVPHALPPAIAYTPALVANLSLADQALGGINQLSSFIPNPRLMIMPMAGIEAVSSSKIEGTVTTVDEVFEAQVTSSDGHAEPVHEVLNYLRALEDGANAARERSLDLGLVRSLHRQLMDGTHGRHKQPGEFRRVQVYVGTRYVPPPAELLPGLLANWQDFVARATASSAIVQCAIMHVQFELIHPFLDGNGRVGRLLMTLLLIKRGCLREPLLSLSPYFERNRREYYDRLLAVSQKGDWEGWIEFFCRAVKTQAEYGIRTAKSLTELREEFYRTVGQATSSAGALEAVDLLFEHPYLTSRTIVERLAMTAQGARKMLASLERLGIIAETPSQQRGRVYCAERVLEVIREAESPNAYEGISAEEEPGR